MKVEIELDDRLVMAKASAGSLAALRRSGAYIRTSARHKVHLSPTASAPGTPPHSRRGSLKRALLFGVDKKRSTVLIGPSVKFLGSSLTAHEFGGVYRRERYQRRPLMGPTLQQTAPKISKFWENSVKR